jgi:hypothetical protein
MDGRKIDWLNKTIALELGETTPINIPRLANVNAVTTSISTKYPQLTGRLALKNGPAVTVMIIDTRSM